MTNILPERELSEVSVVEEATEVIKEFCKAARFGWHDVNPLDGTSPGERVMREIGDLIGSIAFFLETHPDIAELYMPLMEEHAYGRKAKLLKTNDPVRVEAWKQQVFADIVKAEGG